MKKATALETKATISLNKQLNDRTKVLVGFSGGADSMALLCFTAKHLGKESVAALHVNHGLRGKDADADEAFCKKFCADNGIEFYVSHIDVKKECGGSAIEETARKMRYAELYKTAEKTGAGAIALAHTASDNAETLIFNICRGCGISGLGIPPTRNEKDIPIIRPLIECSRDEVIEYIEKNNLLYVTDKTNSDANYTRNFIRMSIIPLLDDVNKQATKNISALSSRARCDEDFIDGFASSYANRADALRIKSLRSLHPAVLSRVIMKKAAEGGADTLSYSNIEAVISLIESGKSGAETELPGDVCAVVADGRLRFGRDVPRFKAGSFEFAAENGVSSDEFGFEISFEKPIKTEGKRIFSAEITESARKGLSVRRRTAGDSYRSGGMTKIIKKLTTGVPYDARSRRPVFVSDGQIVWYPGFPVSDDVKGGNVKIYYTEKIIWSEK